MRIEDLRIGMKVYIDATGYGVLTVSKLGVAGFFTEKGYFNYKCSWIDWGKTASLNDLSAQEQSQYTFNDLIDVAVQANKDRVINGFSVVGGVLNCQTLDGEDYNLGIGCEVAHGIEYLQSLYKETFVIESIEDIRRIKNSANITLSNGNRIERAVHENKGDYVVFNDSNDDFYTFDFVVLKGATVEQDRNV